MVETVTITDTDGGVLSSNSNTNDSQPEGKIHQMYFRSSLWRAGGFSCDGHVLYVSLTFSQTKDAPPWDQMLLSCSRRVLLLR